MKVTSKPVRVTDVTLELTVDEARQLAGLCYMTSCSGDSVTLSGLIVEGEQGQYGKMPRYGFDSELFTALTNVLPPIGDDK